jgi:hypothetical protein
MITWALVYLCVKIRVNEFHPTFFILTGMIDLAMVLIVSVSFGNGGGS